MPVIWNDEVERGFDERIVGLVKETAGIIMDEAKRITSETQGHINPSIHSAPKQPPYMQTHELTDSITITYDQSQPLCAYVIADPVDKNTGKHYGYDVHQGFYWDGVTYDWEHGNVKDEGPPSDVAARPFFFIAMANTTMEILGIWGAV